MDRPRRIRLGVVAGFLAAFAVLAPSFLSLDSASAAQRARAARPARAPAAAPLPALERDAAFIVDGATGRVLYSRNADAQRYPASLTKMMTLYLLFEALNKGSVTLETELTTSTRAAAQFPTKLGLKPGDTVPVDIAIKAVAVLSANDVAVVIAEALGGSEENFAALMTTRAHALGMNHSNFNNASGLPDKQQLTSASDMALLGRHLAYDFPQYYHYFSTASFGFNRRVYNSHDYLLEGFAGTDGIKTGYTRASGFNLVTSVVRNNKHVIGVVMGGISAPGRDREMVQLLASAYALSDMDRTLLADANPPWLGGKGPGTDPFKELPAATPGDSNVLVAPADADPNAPQTAAAPAAPDPVAAIDPAQAAAGVTVNLLPQIPPPRRAATPPARRNTRGAAIIPPIPPPVQQPEISQGDGIDPALTADPSAAAKRWAIQIGAFANSTLAEERLASYAKLALDVFGGAQRFVIPFEAVDGHTLYRARFGMFAENEARDICKRMTQRGQACFAARQFN